MDERKPLFVKALARYLVGNQAEKSIKLQLSQRDAIEWRDVRQTTPLHGYPTIEEAENQLADWLGISLQPPVRMLCHQSSFAKPGHMCYLEKGHKEDHDFQPVQPLKPEGGNVKKPKPPAKEPRALPPNHAREALGLPPLCSFPGKVPCKNKPLKGLSMCRKHQPFPART